MLLRDLAQRYGHDDIRISHEQNVILPHVALADLPALPPPVHPDPDDLARVLAEHGVRSVDWTSWLRLDAEEIRLGQARGADRIKVAALADMLAAVHGATTGPDSRN